jgi:adenylate kinase
MIVFTTGISGSGEKDYLNKFIEYAKTRGKKVKVYTIGNMMFEHANNTGIPVNKKNILNTNPNVLNSLRGAVLEKILGNLECDNKEYDVVIIGMHTMFFWKKIFIRAYEKYYLDKINPDLFISFLDDSADIKKRLDEKEQWKTEYISEDEILLWQNIEAEMTANFADFQNKPFYVYPIKHELDTLYKLIFHPRMEPVYLSVPMTYSSSENSIKIDDFIKKLNRYFCVFDPRTIKTAAENPSADKTVYYQTINRDLYWLIKQSKKVIGYFPEIVASSGVINELREGYETNKDVWLVFPSNKRSPFTDYFTTKVFETDDELFIHIKKYISDKYGVDIN